MKPYSGIWPVAPTAFNDDGTLDLEGSARVLECMIDPTNPVKVVSALVGLFFGLDYERCADAETKRNWNLDTGEGREKVFQVRKIYNDVTFIDEFVNEEFAEAQKLYVYGVNPQTGQHEIVDRDYRKVKHQLLNALTNFGNPIISVVDANYRNRGELYMHHEWVGVDLQFDYANQTLRYLQELWQQAHSRHVKRAHQRESRQNRINMSGSLIARTETWDKCTRSLQVFCNFLRIKHNRRIEETEENNQA